MLSGHMTSSSSPAAMPPLSFGLTHSPAPSTSGESTTSTPVGGTPGGFFHLQLHRQLLQQHQQQQQQQQHQQFHAGVMVDPRLHLNTMLAVDDGEYYDRSDVCGGGNNNANSPRDSSNDDDDDAGTGALALSPACSFEAFSLHFHLPLKTAAEKFGVRATAFKKRCRAIGIRHWPYRKVRSLKRSLQELGRCHEQGALNDKQQYQYVTFKKQLDKLMAPETYGIDPSGRLPHTHFDDSDDESDGNDSCASATPSPRYGATFTDCSISPMDGDKTFGDFSTSTPSHLRALRHKQQTQVQQMPTSQFLQPPPPPPHFSKTLPLLSPELMPLHRMPSAQSSKEATGLYHKFPLAMFDPFPHDATIAAAERIKASAMRVHMQQQQNQQPLTSDNNNNNNMGSDTQLQPQMQVHEPPFNAADVRPLADGDDAFADPSAQTLDYTNDRFFDDVFLQISPDYGCLV